MPDAPRFAYETSGGMMEVPPTTLRMFNRNLPSSGGGYFRLMPYALSRWMLQQVNRQDEQSAIFYFHPWEIDPGNRAWPASTSRPAFATTSTSAARNSASRACWTISNGTAWTTSSSAAA